MLTVDKENHALKASALEFTVFTVINTKNLKVCFSGSVHSNGVSQNEIIDHH